MGLGTKMYGEAMRRMPKGFDSGISVSDSAQGVWQKLRRTKGYSVAESPDSKAYALKNGKRWLEIDSDLADAERVKGLSGLPVRKLTENLYGGKINPKAAIKQAAATPVLPKDQEFLDEHFSISPAWKQFHKNLKQPQFVSTVRQDSRADNKLKRFARMVGTREQSKAKPVAVVGDSGKKYKIKYHPEAGRFSCSCPDWTYKRSVRNKGAGGECKHIKRLRQANGSSMMDKMANPLLDILRLGAGVKREEISRDKSKKLGIQYKAYKAHFPQESILSVLGRSGGLTDKIASVRGAAAKALLAKK